MRPQRDLLATTLAPFLLLALVSCSPTPAATLAQDVPTAGPTPAAVVAVPTPTTASVAEPDGRPLSSELLEKARRQRRNGELAAALQSYRQLAERGPLRGELLLELAEVQLASGEAESARASLQRLLDSERDELLRARAQLLLAMAEVHLGQWDSALARMDIGSAPDGLADLIALQRAEAAALGEDWGRAKAELARPELRQSTNRLVLEQAARLAGRAGEPGLAAELYLQASRYPGWAAHRGPLIMAAAGAFVQAGQYDRAVEQYRRIVEGYYGWTGLASKAAAELGRLGALTAYHRGLVALGEGLQESAVAAFSEAARAGPYAAEATRQLRRLEEAMAWRTALSAQTPAALRSFRARYPDGAFAVEAWFQEGFAHYQAGRFAEALKVWDEALARGLGSDAARFQFWAGKALQQMGSHDEAQERWRQAAETRPFDYYSLRARDLLAGHSGWPMATGTEGPSAALGRQEVQEWLAAWGGPELQHGGPLEERVRRGLGLLALGLDQEAAVEFDALIEETRDPHLLYRLVELLGDHGLWSQVARAAWRLIALSPARTPAEAPPAVARLAYPPAYWDLVRAQAQRFGLDPLLLLALVRQESSYDPFALSIADARGLTQVIPPTAQGIAAALGRRDFSPDELHRPVTAIEFGAWYLANQLARFDNDPFRALAAYNAGPGAVPRWAAADPDVFVERIAYGETKNYVRSIYVHHAIYRSLAGRDPVR